MTDPATYTCALCRNIFTEPVIETGPSFAWATAKPADSQPGPDVSGAPQPVCEQCFEKILKRLSGFGIERPS